MATSLPCSLADRGTATDEQDQECRCLRQFLDPSYVGVGGLVYFCLVSWFHLLWRALWVEFASAFDKVLSLTIHRSS